MSLKILMPLPRNDFDPTEAGVSWKILNEGGGHITFATPDGKAAEGDVRMLTGRGLGPFKSFLRADAVGLRAYGEMSRSSEFLQPKKWSDLSEENFDGILLPGGHAKGMREYLESHLLQKVVADFFRAKKPVAAICHGVVLASRSLIDGKSVLWGKKTTALLSSQEMAAWGITCLFLGSYYRTYKESVQSEVTSKLASPSDFISGPKPFLRDNPENLDRGFTVLDGNYLSARWPGDAHHFATKFLQLLK